MTYQRKKDMDPDIVIGLPEGQSWGKEELTQVKNYAKTINQERSLDRQVHNKLLGIRYQMEEYVDDKETDISRVISVEAFLKMYLKTLNLSLKKFAIHIDTTDGNLKKYLTGSRTFNTDLALKFGHFFHTEPDLWLRVQLKNELIELKKQKAHAKKYEKYDYEKAMAFGVGTPIFMEPKE